MTLDGTWNLEVSTPFGKHPATLVFKRAGGALDGKIKSQLGNAPLRDINVGDDGFDANVSLELQGRTFQARIKGTVSGDDLNGTIKPDLTLAPTVKYTGTRGVK
jgi:hypothetical protein